MQVQHMDIPYNTIGEFTMLILKRFTCTVKKAKKSTFFKVDFLHSVEKLNGQGTLCEYLVKMEVISVPGYSLSSGRATSRFLR